MNPKKFAFTIIEVLISIMLLSFVLIALYKSSDVLRDSNMHLFKHLEKSSHTLKGSKTLYMDLMYADYNISINSDDKIHRLTINNTNHSLYGLSQVKVVWLVYKTDNTLLRIEGGDYHIPLRSEERVEIDVINQNIELFKIYKSKKKDKILAMIKIKNQNPQIFMVQNIALKPPKRQQENNQSKGKSAGKNVYP